MPVFGNQNQESGSLYVSNFLRGTEFTCPQAGSAQSITAYIDASATGKIRFAIYKSSDDSLVGYTEEGTDLPTGWQALDIVSGGSLEAADYYLVAWANAAYKVAKKTQMNGAYQSYSYDEHSGIPPNPWTKSSASAYFSIYCTYSTGGQTHYGSATLAGTGALAGSAVLTIKGSATLSGIGSLAAVATKILLGSAVLAGAGSLAAAGSKVLSGAAIMAGVGSLAAAGTIEGAIKYGAATLSGVGSLAAAGVKLLSGAATMAGAGSLAASAVLTLAAKVLLSGIGSLSAIGGLLGEVFGSATLSGQGFLSVIAESWHILTSEEYQDLLLGQIEFQEI
jgi:hypothetical protein